MEGIQFTLQISDITLKTKRQFEGNQFVKQKRHTTTERVTHWRSEINIVQITYTAL